MGQELVSEFFDQLRILGPIGCEPHIDGGFKLIKACLDFLSFDFGLRELGDFAFEVDELLLF